MNRQTTFALIAATTSLPLYVIAANLGSAPPRAAAETTPAAPAAPELLASPNAEAVVDAANAFLATLTEKQRAVAQIDLNHRLAARWSNFPGGSNLRNGVFFREMNETQAAAAIKVAQAALGEEGFKRFQEVRAADDAFKSRAGRGPGGRGGPGGPGGRGGPGAGPGGPPPGGGPFADSDTNKDGKLSRDEAPGFLRDRFDEIDANKDGFISREEDTAFMRQRGGRGGPGGPGGPGGGPGGGGFGSANYMIAMLGKPSKTTPWLLQLGGHHLAFNIYYKGTGGAATPYFVGVQPNRWKDEKGKMHAPLAPMRDAMHDLVASLTPEQSTRAKLAGRFRDVYVGPGRDGQFPATSEGVPVSELSAASKELVKRAIAAWTGDSPQAEEYQKLYYAELDRVKVSYSGSTEVASGGDYVRLDGPRVWIEFCCQGEDHYHTIWRDRLTDYGAEFSF